MGLNICNPCEIKIKIASIFIVIYGVKLKGLLVVLVLMIEFMKSKRPFFSVSTMESNIMYIYSMVIPFLCLSKSGRAVTLTLLSVWFT